MKLLSSPHSNSSFDPIICSSTNATASCLTGILRRFLCSQTIPSHPCDHITDTVTPPSSSSCHQPGIVGRLMGLDSVPPTQSTDGQNDLKRKPLNSKLSFLGMPTFFEVENEDFFILTFDKTETSSERPRRRRRKGTSRSNENTSTKVDKEIDDEAVLRASSNEDSTKLTGKKNRSVEEQENSCSQDSSPVSVLHFNQFLFDPQAKSGDCTIRRKLSSRLEHYTPLSSYTNDNRADDDQNSKITEETRQESVNRYSPKEQLLNRQGEICRLAKAQVVKWNWKFNDFEDISADFGSEIMDQLLQELVAQFLT